MLGGAGQGFIQWVSVLGLCRDRSHKITFSPLASANLRHASACVFLCPKFGLIACDRDCSVGFRELLLNLSRSRYVRLFTALTLRLQYR